MASLDVFIVNVAFPDIARDFSGASLSNLSWVLNAYAIAFAALLVPAGRIADRVGRKRVFISGLLVFAGASLLCAAASSIEMLVAARGLQGIGGALMLPPTLGLILPAFPPAQRPTAIGIWSAVAGIAAGLGPALGAFLIPLSWRWIFIVNVPVALVAALLALRVLEEAREPERERPDLLGAVLLAAAIALLVLGIVKGHEWGWESPRVLASFAAAAALVTRFVLRSARHPAPVIELPLLRIRSFALANLATVVFMTGFGAMLVANILLLTEVWRYSPLQAGLAFTPGPAAAAFAAAASGRLGPRLGPGRVAVAGSLLFALGYGYALASVGDQREFLASFMPAFAVSGFGVGMVLGTLPAVIAATLPPARLATGTAVFSMARQLGTAIGVAVVVALIGDSTGGDLLAGLRRGWWFSLAAGLLTAALALSLGPDAASRQSGVELAPQRAT